MRTATTFIFLLMLVHSTTAADALPANPSFAIEPAKLRSYEIEIPHLAKSIELSSGASRTRLEADILHFKTMNGRDLLDLMPRPEPPMRALRFLNALLPAGGVFAKNPNAPPATFTR